MAALCIVLPLGGIVLEQDLAGGTRGSGGGVGFSACSPHVSYLHGHKYSSFAKGMEYLL